MGKRMLNAAIVGLGRWGQFSQFLLGPRRIDYIFFRPQLTVLSAEKIDYDGGLSALGYVAAEADPQCGDNPWKKNLPGPKDVQSRLG